MIWPIFIPSKGRAGKSKLIDTLFSENQEFVVCLEQEDVADYVQAWPKIKISILQESNKGIAYARNHVLSRARRLALGWYWMFDDDINGFYVVKDRKTIRTPIKEVLSKAQGLISKQVGVAQASLEYAQFAWAQSKPVKLNSYCDVAVAINAQSLKTISYRDTVNLKEDRDFTLQVLSMGYSTLRCAQLAFSAPKNGSNKGGLHEVYSEQGREASASEKMCQLWPGICTPITKSNGRRDVKINWKLFSSDL